MANIKSAAKQARQNILRKKHNLMRKKALKQVVSELRHHVATGNKESAQQLLPQLAKMADKAASHGPFHKNKASRIKSRMTKRVYNM
ncbi:30S ribosomal protein S20 [Candidatus Acetothermia bacterium]|nr:30S ribosomal protein S20 [Candidatus Acetothermia bacterium]MCI2426458.1 30S ribosomal protein S20 [Candidatus Acetothermia bacterium]MCI2427566.1 30S ribosomal protein S20 [Candidatus Acetothermia bacterium]MCI2428244.1 30S ribosomal protein S20 [Candidatus Acetothermia bacterium]